MIGLGLIGCQASGWCALVRRGGVLRYAAPDGLGEARS
jgi:hypothetical protein